MTFRFLINQIIKSKKSYLDLHESMTAWLFKLQQKNVFVVNEQWRHVFSKNKIKLLKWNIDKNDLLHWMLTVYMPKNAITINKILHKNHDDSNVKHFSKKRTKKTIKKNIIDLIWSNKLLNMFTFVLFVNACVFIIINLMVFWNQFFLMTKNHLQWWQWISLLTCHLQKIHIWKKQIISFWYL